MNENTPDPGTAEGNPRPRRRGLLWLLALAALLVAFGWLWYEHGDRLTGLLAGGERSAPPTPLEARVATLEQAQASLRESIEALVRRQAENASALRIARDRSHVPVGLLYEAPRPGITDQAARGAVAAAGDPAAALEDRAAAFGEWMDGFRVR